MEWLAVALLSYLGFALVAVSDRYFLKGPLRSPALFAAASGVLSILSFTALALDWFVPNATQFILDFCAGAVFVFGLWAYFVALKHGEASRVVPLSSVFVPLFTLLLAQHLLSEQLSQAQLMGFGLLVIGGVIISVGAYNGKKIYHAHKTHRSIKISEGAWAIAGMTMGASFLFALHLYLLKEAYNSQPFVGALVWSSVGKFIAALFLLFILHLKKSLPHRLKPVSQPKYVSLYLITRIIGAGAGIGQNYAIALASVTVVSALQGFQHLFLFALIYFIGRKVIKLRESFSGQQLIIKILAVILLSAGLILIYPQKQSLNKYEYGVTFSHTFAKYGLNANWQKVYDDIMEELNISWIRIPVYWSEVEPEQNTWNIETVDYQVKKAAEKNIKIILAVGRKLPRWPECHVPLWAEKLPLEEQDTLVLNYIQQIVKFYDNQPAIVAWQVENEPLFPFGICPDRNINFLHREIALVKSLSNKPIIITDSGEFTNWIPEAKMADILGTTMYRQVHNKHWGEIRYPIPTFFFRLKSVITKTLSGKPGQSIINVELQAEPWGNRPLNELPILEQSRLMNPEQFLANVKYAQKIGFSPILFWGVEWWWWMKEVHDQPDLWYKAKEVINN